MIYITVRDGFIIYGGIKMKRILLFIIVFALLSSILTGCNYNNAAQNAEPKANKTVKIGLLPDVDSLPFIVAKEAGFFKETGVSVELVTFKSAQERDSAFQSGNVDGVVSDMLAAILAINGGFKVKITSHTDGKYKLLASKQSGAKQVSDLRGGEIAISKNTIIEYSVDAMLKNKGINPEDIKKTVIPQIPVRLQMLDSGKISAACLPDPLATQAEKNGAIVLDDTGKLGNTLGVMLFSEASIKDKKDEIKRVYESYELAKEELNKNSDKYRSILVEKAGFPETVKDIIQFPKYKKSYLPTMDDFNLIYNWMKDKELVKKNIDYNNVVTKEFIK
jgi:NitT/TauT family transport system substrate-binding protein